MTAADPAARIAAMEAERDNFLRLVESLHGERIRCSVCGSEDRWRHIPQPREESK